MSSEISHGTIVEFRFANTALLMEVRQLREELKAAITLQDRRSVARLNEIELRLTKWGATVLLMSIAFTLLLAFLTKPERPTTPDPVIATAESSG